MTTLAITQKDTQKDIYAKIDETGDEDVVTEAVASATKPEDGDGYWWKKINIMQFSGIWADGKTEATITIDDNLQVTF